MSLVISLLNLIPVFSCLLNFKCYFLKMAGFRVFLVSLSTLIFCACSVAYGEDMASNLTELSTWTNPILGPDPGDALQATPVRTMAEEINGRTNVLREVSPYHTTDVNYWTSMSPFLLTSGDVPIINASGLGVGIAAAAGQRLFRIDLRNDAISSAYGNRKVKSIVLFVGAGYIDTFNLYWDDSNTVLDSVAKAGIDTTVTFSAPFPASVASRGGLAVGFTNSGAPNAAPIAMRALVVFEGATVP